MEEVLVKCPKCEADVISGQLFCANCGTKQELKLRNEKEITEMLERIDKILSVKNISPNGPGAVGSMMMVMLLEVVSSSCLKWVLGITEDKKLLGLFESALKQKGIEPK